MEWLGVGSGGGSQTLALVAAREACRDGKSLVVVDRTRRFYPPAAAAWGIDLSRLIVVHPASEADELWAIDQALRCRGEAAGPVQCRMVELARAVRCLLTYLRARPKSGLEKSATCEKNQDFSGCPVPPATVAAGRQSRPVQGKATRPHPNDHLGRAISGAASRRSAAAVELLAESKARRPGRRRARGRGRESRRW